MKVHIKHAQYLVLGILLILFLLLVFFLNKPIEGSVPTAASKAIFEKAQVLEVISEQASPDVWTEGLRIGAQEVIIRVDSGTFKGEELYTVNFMSAYGNIDLKEGSKIIVRLDTNSVGNPYVITIFNYDRSSMLIALVFIFVLLLIVIGGKKGLSSVLGLLFTIFSIWFFLIPLIKRGVPAVPSAILLISITTFFSLVLLNGFSKKTFVAVIGCIGGVTIAGIIALIAGYITPITGFNMSEAEEMVLRSDGVLIKGLLVSGVLIASLGAVMDVAMTISSAISELHDMNPKATKKMLFTSGLNIGKDAMGTMANTLILAFAGASLNMLVLFRIFDYPYIQIFNSDLMSIEIIQGISGSIGIVLTVPLVAMLGAMLFSQNASLNVKRR